MAGNMLVVMQEQQRAAGLDGEDKYLRARTTRCETAENVQSKYVEYGRTSSPLVGMAKKKKKIV